LVAAIRIGTGGHSRQGKRCTALGRYDLRSGSSSFGGYLGAVFVHFLEQSGPGLIIYNRCLFFNSNKILNYIPYFLIIEILQHIAKLNL
jgi:hypothetical protein